MKEAFQSEVLLRDVRLKGFKELMNFIYTGKLNLETADKDTLLDLLEVAHLYGFEKVQSAICAYFHKSLSVVNVWAVFNVAIQLSIEQLTETCCDFMEDFSGSILLSENFCRLTAVAICKLLSRDTFFADEIEIFKAVEKWCKVLPRDERDVVQVLASVRLPFITTTMLSTTVWSSGLISAETIIEAIAARRCGLLKKTPRKRKTPVCVIVPKTTKALKRLSNGTPVVCPSAGGTAGVIPR